MNDFLTEAKPHLKELMETITKLSAQGPALAELGKKNLKDKLIDFSIKNIKSILIGFLFYTIKSKFFSYSNRFINKI